jgi:hypothetical protein
VCLGSAAFDQRKRVQDAWPKPTRPGIIEMRLTKIGRPLTDIVLPAAWRKTPVALEEKKTDAS